MLQDVKKGRELTREELREYVRQSPEGRDFLNRSDEYLAPKVEKILDELKKIKECSSPRLNRTPLQPKISYSNSLRVITITKRKEAYGSGRGNNIGGETPPLVGGTKTGDGRRGGGARQYDIVGCP